MAEMAQVQAPVQESAVVNVESKDQFDEAIKSEHLTVVDFTATWCPPCQRIKPMFKELAGQLKGEVVMMACDVDDQEDTSEACGIEAMPTFQLYKNGEKVDEMQGADFEGLK